jgi:hypothetical protein
MRVKVLVEEKLWAGVLTCLVLIPIVLTGTVSGDQQATDDLILLADPVDQVSYNRDMELTCLCPALYYVKPRLSSFISGSYYTRILDWRNKSFPCCTCMFIGDFIGSRPFCGVKFMVLSLSSDPPKKIDLYSDDALYDTQYPVQFPPKPYEPICYLYRFTYKNKGFHHIELLPDNCTGQCIEMDFQIGLKGFTQNILPYLLEF